MTFALQVLIASSVFCVVIITLLLVQKNGYLKHKIFTILMLLSSMLFLTAASAFFYFEYSGYQGLKKRNGKTSNTNQKLDEYKFTAIEIDVLKEFSEAKNTLSGYEQFLEESAEKYNPDDFSYGNLLIEDLISKFGLKEYTLEYWQEVDTVLNSIYKGDNPYGIWREDEYFAIAIVPSNSKFYNSFQILEDIKEYNNSEEIEYASKIKYLQRKIKDFDRSSESIKELWVTNKVFVYTIMSKSRYNLISKMVEDLVKIYERIIQEPNYREFYETHNIFTESNEYQLEYDNKVFLSFPSKDFVESFDDYWGFGFWDRRFEENNDQTVYKILKEIQAHYND